MLPETDEVVVGMPIRVELVDYVVEHVAHRSHWEVKVVDVAGRGNQYVVDLGQFLVVEVALDALT